MRYRIYRAYDPYGPDLIVRIRGAELAATICETHAARLGPLAYEPWTLGCRADLAWHRHRGVLLATLALLAAVLFAISGGPLPT